MQFGCVSGYSMYWNEMIAKSLFLNWVHFFSCLVCVCVSWLTLFYCYTIEWQDSTWFGEKYNHQDIVDLLERVGQYMITWATLLWSVVESDHTYYCHSQHTNTILMYFDMLQWLALIIETGNVLLTCINNILSLSLSLSLSIHSTTIEWVWCPSHITWWDWASHNSLSHYMCPPPYSVY